MALRRLRKEIGELTQLPGCVIDTTEVFTWIITIAPPDTVYSHAAHRCTLVFTQAYPFTAPEIKFTGNHWHPNISASGKICLELLDTKWTPVTKLHKLIEDVYSLFLAPNLSEPLNVEAAKMWGTEEFRKKLLNL